MLYEEFHIREFKFPKKSTDYKTTLNVLRNFINLNNISRDSIIEIKEFNEGIALFFFATQDLLVDLNEDNKLFPIIIKNHLEKIALHEPQNVLTKDAINLMSKYLSYRDEHETFGTWLEKNKRSDFTALMDSVKSDIPSFFDTYLAYLFDE